MKAAAAQRMASNMLPCDLAGWKYTVMVATMCFPSCFPSIFAITGTNVARLPRKYAILHLSTPLPVFDFANAQPCNSKTCHLASTRWSVPCPLEGLTIFFEALRVSRGAYSVAPLLSLEPSRPAGPPKVTVRLTRSPVLGRMRVAWRSYGEHSISPLLRCHTC